MDMELLRDMGLIPNLAVPQGFHSIYCRSVVTIPSRASAVMCGRHKQQKLNSEIRIKDNRVLFRQRDYTSGPPRLQIHDLNRAKQL